MSDAAPCAAPYWRAPMLTGLFISLTFHHAVPLAHPMPLALPAGVDERSSLLGGPRARRASEHTAIAVGQEVDLADFESVRLHKTAKSGRQPGDHSWCSCTERCSIC